MTSARATEERGPRPGLQPPRAARSPTAMTRRRPARTNPTDGASAAVRATAMRPASEARDDGHRDPDLRVDDVAEVVDDAGEDLGPGPAAEPGRRERDEAGVHLDPATGEVVEGGVVGADPLDVAEVRPGHAEGADGDDGGQQGEDDRPLAGADDEPAGRRREGDARRGGRAADEPGEDDGRARGGRDGAAGAHRSSPPDGVSRGAVRWTCWSARATSSRRWVTAMTVCRSARPRMTSWTVSVARSSRWAVGSSRRTTGAVVRVARARASRARWPGRQPEAVVADVGAPAHGRGRRRTRRGRRGAGRPRAPSSSAGAEGEGRADRPRGEERPLGDTGGPVRPGRCRRGAHAGRRGSRGGWTCRHRRGR